MNLADTIVVIAQGKIRTQGSKEEIFPNLLNEFEENCRFVRKEDAVYE
jgi:ABC-type sugar transport system ATPase subunit